jgi:hypothetical protein
MGARAEFFTRIRRMPGSRAYRSGNSHAATASTQRRRGNSDKRREGPWHGSWRNTLCRDIGADGLSNCRDLSCDPRPGATVTWLEVSGTAHIPRATTLGFSVKYVSRSGPSSFRRPPLACRRARLGRRLNRSRKDARCSRHRLGSLVQGEAPPLLAVLALFLLHTTPLPRRPVIWTTG